MSVSKKIRELPQSAPSELIFAYGCPQENKNNQYVGIQVFPSANNRLCTVFLEDYLDKFPKVELMISATCCFNLYGQRLIKTISKDINCLCISRWQGDSETVSSQLCCYEILASLAGAMPCSWLHSFLLSFDQLTRKQS